MMNEEGHPQYSDNPDDTSSVPASSSVAGGGRPIYLDNVHDMHHQSRRSCCSKWVMWGSAAAVVLIVIVGTSLGVAKKNKTSSSTAQEVTPTVYVSDQQYKTNKNELGNHLISLYEARGLDWSDLQSKNSAEGKSLTFVAGANEYASQDRDQNVQRFVLGCLYYSTFAKTHDFLPVANGWKRSNGWVTQLFECQWEGITCNDSDEVTTLNLANNGLSGTLPVELSFLPALAMADFTTNLIFMADFALFGVWNTIRELTMDDNYIYTENGLPTQLANMTSLAKLSLSYNLLQGSIVNSMWSGLTQLTHLEVESNYLSGSIPTNLAELPNLVYMYVRRNDFQFALSSLIYEGSLPSIFALWLDSNVITGSIPTAIGTLTDLASLSLTNSTISGSLPSQLGSLVGMKRCWLYDNGLTGAIPTTLSAWTGLQVLELYGNKLQGTMPSAVCTAVEASDYEYATLSADCSSGQVSCDCCLECY